ncbi:hypothetical protein RFI_30128 [Reticulomyxa filosa]|uniref:Uncharacterized protein n=1 Tax=Reticulomyxa filosa TaxID=46433 RepID=X6M055_RETFI|nr:hypothetical protein RFI_30128 [Reticulomyxa filosa]|eukprot:ETO07264.1 hypothetical protein RFI_30128 [Reticulomyxa filosa]
MSTIEYKKAMALKEEEDNKIKAMKSNNKDKANNDENDNDNNAAVDEMKIKDKGIKKRPKRILTFVLKAPKTMIPNLRDTAKTTTKAKASAKTNTSANANANGDENSNKNKDEMWCECRYQYAIHKYEDIKYSREFEQHWNEVISIYLWNRLHHKAIEMHIFHIQFEYSKCDKNQLFHIVKSNVQCKNDDDNSY